MQKQLSKPLTEILDDSITIIRTKLMEDFIGEIKNYSNSNQLKYSHVLHFLRLSLMNKKTGPPVTEIFELIGHTRVIQYLENAKNYTAKLPDQEVIKTSS